VSRWSRALRIAALLPAGLLCPHAVGAQDTAILRTGPAVVRGIPYLRANVLSAHRGEYLFGSPALPQRDEPGPEAGAGTGSRSGDVTVFHTVSPLVLPAEWPARRCGALRLVEVTGEEGYVLCYRDPRGFTLFFAFSGAESASGACRFVEGFVRRFQALLGFADPKQGPPFPAVLELAR
jgi:hypothetical protein